MSLERYEELKRTGRLQAISPAGNALHQMKRQGECVDSEVVEALAEDPALSEFVLHLANAARDPGVQPFVEIESCVAELAAPRVRMMGVAFALALSNRAGECEQYDYDRSWSLALARAISALVISKRLGGTDPISGFLGAFLSQIGRHALASVYPREYSGLVGLFPEHSEVELRRIERGLFGIDHVQVTLAMLTDLGLSREIIEAVELSDAGYRSLERDAFLPELAGLLQAAHRLGRLYLEDLAPGRKCWIDLVRLRALLNLDREAFNAMGDRIAERWGEWGDLLRIPTRPVPSFSRMAPGEYREASPLHEEEPPTGTSSEPEEDQLRILAVDDDPLTLRLISKHLERGGHKVFTATNGREALLAALHNDPHVVVADWMMPEMNGIELCRALRRFDAGRRIFFMLLTGRDDEERVLEAFDAGVDDFVSKPFRSKLLLARVRASKRVVELQRQIEVDKRMLRESLAEKGELSRRLREAAFTDVLTKLPNRRYAIKRLSEEWAVSDRNSTPLSLVMIDIDHFKRVNDVHGHDVGDIVLRETAAVLEGNSREGESACRLGGEEFLVICAGGDRESATRCGERLRRAVETNLIRAGEFNGNVTISVGVAERGPDVVDADNLLKLADEAVYGAKNSGRNRTVCYGVEEDAREAG